MPRNDAGMGRILRLARNRQLRRAGFHFEVSSEIRRCYRRSGNRYREINGGARRRERELLAFRRPLPPKQGEPSKVGGEGENRDRRARSA